MYKMAKHLGNILVIGISGATNSGKSTLTQTLVKQIPDCHLFQQDTYYLLPGDPRMDSLYIPELNHCNWEDYRALEMDRMVDDVKQHIVREQEKKSENCSLIVIEGFSIFGWRPLSKLFDLKYFLSIDKDTCLERRKTRHYDPPDVPGYFDKIVWPWYLQHLEQIKEQKDIVFLDGKDEIEFNIEKILRDISKLQSDRQIIS